MMNRLKFISIVILAVMVVIGSKFPIEISRTAQAQDSWNATVWFGDESGGWLHIVNGDGVLNTIPVSSDLVGSNPYETSEVFTSADNRYILHYGFDLVEERQFLRFGQTGDGPCCVDVVDLIGEVLAFDVAGFEPDGSRFAISYVKANEIEPPFDDGMAVIDAATGEIEIEINMGIAMSVLGRDENPAWALLGDWTEAGILFLGHCYACDGIPSGEYAVWQPDLTYIGSESGVYYEGFGDRLELTDEFLLQTQDTRYIYNAIQGMIPQPNVIQYFPSSARVAAPTVVYANTAQLYAGPVYWVGDGQAMLDVTNGGESWDVVYRDGRLEHIGGRDGFEFLGGSPDGWFAIGEDAGNPALFHFDLDSLEPTFVAPANTGTVKIDITQMPPLGASVSTPSFAALPPPDMAQTARCPDFLPSRLVVGQAARVTPGAANRMRSYAGSDAEQVGSIPGGATFIVLEGPLCDVENSLAWWRVEYNGIEGWTAEGQGETYWTEPIR
jgi:hypothetical protein